METHVKKKIPLVLFDQIIVSGSNFLLSIFILRFLGAEIFGVFTFLWLFILFFNSIQMSLIISPMMTNLVKYDQNQKNNFISGIFLQQIIFCLFTSLLLNLVFNFYGDYINNFNISKFSFSITILFIFTQFQQFFRRLSFLNKDYNRAIISDLISYSILFILIIYFEITELFNLELLIWLLGISFFFGNIIYIFNIFKFKVNFFYFLSSFRNNWKISKWLFLTSLLQWFSGNFWIINTGLILGPYALGVLRACQTIINITNLAFQSFENLFPSKFSEIYINKGKKHFKEYFINFIKNGLVYIVLTIIFFIFFSKKILIIVFGLDISQYSKILIYLSLILPITFLIFPITYSLRTVGKTKYIFIGYLSSSLFTLSFSNIIISKFDMPGTVLGLFLSSIIVLLVTFYSYKKNIE
jgi:O-antigen/teichoic acid export membrane protein